MPTQAFPTREQLVARMNQELTGKVRAVKFFDPDSHAIIATLDNGVAVKGEVDGDGLDVGTAYRFFGKPSEHPRWGKQFAFDTYTVDTPHERKGVIAYLCREARHVGQAVAGRLWDTYGADAIEVLRTDPERVATDGLMGGAEARDAAEDLARMVMFEKTRVDLFNLFAGRGFPRSTVSRCIELWGVRAAEFVRRDPFTMLVRDVPGAGWKRCDKLYLDLGGNPSRLKRQMLAGWNGLREGIDGNTWHPFGAFNQSVVKAVGAHEAHVRRAVDLGLRAGWLWEYECDRGQKWIAEASKAENESSLVEHVWRLQRGECSPWPTLSPPAVSEHQSGALSPHLAAPVLILAGTPGTGKTFTAAALLREVVRQIGSGAVAVCAPTGKAAVRITEAMGRARLPLKATTIHSLLGIGRNGHDGKGWGFVHNAENPLPYLVIAVDELSMCDTDLAADLFRACDHGTKVLLIGDPNQLPPVGHGAPLRDMIAAGVPTATLTEIQRNAGTIVRACASIKDGRRFETVAKLDEDAGDNLRLIECPDEASQLVALERVITAVKQSGRRDPVWGLQVLTPLNEKSAVSRVPLNIRLQGLLNPLAGDAQVDQLGEFRRVDKIICLRNCQVQAVEPADGLPRSDVNGYRPVLDSAWKATQHYLANGDQGRVEALNVEKKTLVARFFHPERLVKIPMGKHAGGETSAGAGAASDFGLAYAITGHKSQGSEWPMVVVMIDDAAGPVACREWIYTAISRASRVCLLIGKRSTIDRQCVRVSLEKRKTFLKELLRHGR